MIISRDPFAATWLQHEDRTTRLRLEANPDYWDRTRGPHLQEVVFRNDLSPEQALDLVCTTEGEIDIVTEVSPADAARVERSSHAKLVATDAIRVIVGMINRDADGLPLADPRARQALNLAMDRRALVRDAMFGHAKPLAGLTPPSAVTWAHRLSPYKHDRKRARKLWQAAGGTGSRAIRIAAPSELERIAQHVATDLQAALGVDTTLTVYRSKEEKLASRRRLAEKTAPQPWDILLHEQGPQAADAPPLELHRAFVGATGEWRAGPISPGFEALYGELIGETSRLKLAHISYRIDKFVHAEALALFLCAPQALYAVNKHVNFTPYRTTFELAQTEVSEKHWSRR